MSRKTKEEVLGEFRCSSIREAAIRVIARKGIEGATVQDIADEAGISKATFYVYFKDREELLSNTSDAIFEQLLEHLEPVFAQDAPLEPRLRDLARRQLAFFEQYRSFFVATQAFSRREGKAPTRCLTRYMAQLEQLFAEAATNRQMRDLEPRTVAAIYRDVIRGAVLRRFESTKRRTSVEADADLIVSILLAGIASGEK